MSDKTMDSPQTTENAAVDAVRKIQQDRIDQWRFKQIQPRPLPAVIPKQAASELQQFLADWEEQSWDPRAQWPNAMSDGDMPVGKQPKEQDCTCDEGEKLDCPVHGMHAANPSFEHTYDIKDPQSPVGYDNRADGPRTWMNAKVAVGPYQDPTSRPLKVQKHDWDATEWWDREFPFSGDEQYENFKRRIPIIYHEPSHTLHIGPGGGTHTDLMKHAGLDENTRAGMGYHGWAGHDAQTAEEHGGPNSEEDPTLNGWGWYTTKKPHDQIEHEIEQVLQTPKARDDEYWSFMSHAHGWVKGRAGKGIVTPHGTIYTWNTDVDGAPHHAEYLDKYLPHADEDHYFFKIKPRGGIDTKGYNMPAYITDIVLKADPRMHADGDTGFHFDSALHYHVTPRENRQSIEEQGLKQSDVDNKHVWMFDDQQLAHEMGKRGWGRRGPNDVWEVNTEGLSLQRDPHPGWSPPSLMQHSWVATEPIPPERLRLTKSLAHVLEGWKEHMAADQADTREYPDTRMQPATTMDQPAQGLPHPEAKGCTCKEGFKLECPVHGMNPDASQQKYDHAWSIPQGHPVGYPQDQPKNYKVNTGAAGDGDGYVQCDQGHTHWGQNGAAGLMLRHVDDIGQQRYLLQHRSPGVMEGNTWSIPGGALDSHETPEEGALREAQEEIGGIPGVQITHKTTADHGNWAYHTVHADVPEAFDVGGQRGWEQSHAGWFTPEEIDQLPLHSGFRSYWNSMRHQAKLSWGKKPKYDLDDLAQLQEAWLTDLGKPYSGERQQRGKPPFWHQIPDTPPAHLPGEYYRGLKHYGDFEGSYLNQLRLMYEHGHVQEPELEREVDRIDAGRSSGPYQRKYLQPHEWQDMLVNRHEYLRRMYNQHPELRADQFETAIERANQAALNHGVDPLVLGLRSDQVTAPQEVQPTEPTLPAAFSAGVKVHEIEPGGEVGTHDMSEAEWIENGGQGRDDQRKPFVYVPKHKTVYLGNPGWYHDDVDEAIFGIVKHPPMPLSIPGIIEPDGSVQVFNVEGNNPRHEEDIYNALGGQAWEPKWQFAGKIARRPRQQYLYHKAPTAERARIESHGLLASLPILHERWTEKGKQNVKDQPQGVYLASEPHGNFGGGTPNPDIWRVDTSYIKHATPDPFWGPRSGAYLVPHDIPPEALTLHEPYEDRNWSWIQSEGKPQSFEPVTPPTIPRREGKPKPEKEKQGKLWVDDTRRPPSVGWDWARNVHDAINKAKAEDYMHMSIDHDLALTRYNGKVVVNPSALNGADFAVWLHEHGDKKRMPASVNIHTHNDAAIEIMKSILEDHCEVTTERAPDDLEEEWAKDYKVHLPSEIKEETVHLPERVAPTKHEAWSILVTQSDEGREASHAKEGGDGGNGPDESGEHWRILAAEPGKVEDDEHKENLMGDDVLMPEEPSDIRKKRKEREDEELVEESGHEPASQGLPRAEGSARLA